MDDKRTKNSRGPCTNVGSKKESKIDIKAMCKKFENTSNDKNADCKQKNRTSHNAVLGIKTDVKIDDSTRSHDIPTFRAKNPGRHFFKESDKKARGSGIMNDKMDSNAVPKFAIREVPHGDIPRAPTRRSRTRSQLQNFGTKDISTEIRKTNSSVKSCNVDTNSSVEKVSVRERTKLFETDSSKSCINSRNSHRQVDEPSLNGKSENSSPRLANAGRNGNKSSSGKERVHLVPNTPPSKPPRTPFRSRTSESKVVCKSAINDPEKSSTKTLSINEKKVLKSSISPPDSPSGHKYEEIEGQISCPPKLRSAPLRLLTDDARESSPKTSRKAQCSRTTKAQGVLNYLKNLSSTATHIREKAKLKPSNVFVDLTPTTVSPPKHHGTLKKSYSDEHIYAEPVFGPASPGKEATALHSDSQVSPYMSTAVVEPVLPRALNSENCPPMRGNRSAVSVHRDTKFGISVRNMIYHSFSSLRSAESAKEDATDMQDDSGSDVSAQDVRERIIYVKSMKSQASVSSICIAPSLFEALFVVCVSKGQPEVVLKFPAKPNRGFDYPLIPHLCFPDLHLLKPVSAYRSETFHFTLINGRDEKIFGYCRRILGWPSQNTKTSFTFPCAICILSCISAPLLYKKLLGEVEKHLILPLEQFDNYLASLQMLGIPNAGANLSIPDHTEGYENARVVILRPLDSHIVSSDFTRILQLLDIEILLKAIASLVLERRVLLLSKYSKDLFQCCEALSSLLYPFHWQHLIIPVLPKCLLVQCCTETPYLLGIISANHTEILELLIEHDILIIDIDKASVVKSQEDENTILPKKVQKALVMALNLAKNMTDPTEMLRDVMISEAFVRVFVETVGHYGEFLSPKDSTATFQKEAFQRKVSSKSIQSFLEWFSETLMFDSFIEECIWRIKYREICQSHQLTFFEKRVEEYKWELAYDNEKLSQIIGKTMKNFGEKLKMLKTF